MYDILYYNSKKTWAGDQNDNPRTPKIMALWLYILYIIKLFIFFIKMLYIIYILRNIFVECRQFDESE